MAVSLRDCQAADLTFVCVVLLHLRGAVLTPGYYAKSMSGVIVTQVAICPQKYYCPGGTPVSAFDPQQPTWTSPNDDTIKACPGGTWTENVGAKSLAQCSEYLLLLLLLQVHQLLPLLA